MAGRHDQHAGRACSPEHAGRALPGNKFRHAALGPRLRAVREIEEAGVAAGFGGFEEKRGVRFGFGEGERSALSRPPSCR